MSLSGLWLLRLQRSCLPAGETQTAAVCLSHAFECSTVAIGDEGVQVEKITVTEAPQELSPSAGWRPPAAQQTASCSQLFQSASKRLKGEVEVCQFVIKCHRICCWDGKKQTNKTLFSRVQSGILHIWALLFNHPLTPPPPTRYQPISSHSSQ